MGKVWGVFLAILAVFLLLGPFRTPIIDGIKGMRTVDTTEAFSVTTGAAEITANMTLGHDLFQDNVSEVITLTSNITGEAPIASSYVSASRFLSISALNPASVHTITVNYYAETDSDVWRAVGPFLGFLVFGFLLFLIIKGAVSKH